MTHTECTGTVPTAAGFVMSVLNGYILLFIIIVSFIWIVLYSFNFSFLRKSCRRSSSSVLVNEGESKGPDTGRCFAGSVVISLFLVGLLWAFKKW